MSKRIVIALGGNALGKNLEQQMDAVNITAKAIADLIEAGYELVIAHGNGPQVGTPSSGRTSTTSRVYPPSSTRTSLRSAWPSSSTPIC